MSDAVKWGLLVAAVAIIGAMITAIPIFAQFGNALGYFAESIINFVAIIASYINKVKSLVLLLVPIGVRTILSSLIMFTIMSFVYLFPINLTKQLYAWIFK